MRFQRAFRGYGDVPSDEDVRFGQQTLQELVQSQTKLKEAFNSLLMRCGQLPDGSLQSTIIESDQDIDNIQRMFNEFLQGGLELPTVTDAVNGHLLANDALLQGISSYGCETVVTPSGIARSSGSGTTTGGGGGGTTGGGTTGGGTTGGGGGGGGGGIQPLPPGPVQAGLGSLGWLGALAVVGYIIYDRYYKKGAKKQRRSKRTTRRMPVRRRRA